MLWIFLRSPHFVWLPHSIFCSTWSSFPTLMHDGFCLLFIIFAVVARTHSKPMKFRLFEAIVCNCSIHLFHSLSSWTLFFHRIYQSHDRQKSQNVVLVVHWTHKYPHLLSQIGTRFRCDTKIKSFHKITSHIHTTWKKRIFLNLLYQETSIRTHTDSTLHTHWRESTTVAAVVKAAIAEAATQPTLL